jgi:hypothetical protein
MDGSCHDFDSKEKAYAQAGALAFADAVQKAGGIVVFPGFEKRNATV